MNDILVSMGYRFDRSCNCGGMYNEIYNKKKGDSLEVWTRPNQSSFVLKRDGAIFKRGQSASLQSALQEVSQFV